MRWPVTRIPARRDPTRWAARVDVSQPAASRAHREPDGASSQSSATGVGAQTGTISPSSAMRPAPSIVSTSQAARVESTSSDSDRRRRSRTASPPVRSTRGGAGPQSSMASSTRASRSLTSPPAAASTRSVPIEVVAASGGVRATSWCSRPPRSSSATSRGSSTRVSVSPRARSVTVGVTTWSSRWSSSQRTPSDPGASRLTTPTGGPQTSRSSTLRADSGASATTSRISCGGNGLRPELQRGRTQPRGVGAEHLRCCADRIQALGCPPHQGEVPEPLELRPDVQPAHQLVDRARTRPVAGHDDGLEDLEVSEVEALDRALDAGAGSGAGSE